MKLRTKLFSAVLAAGLVVGAASVSNATNGYYMIGTGAKSLGMAGAVVANPQDASTILQNPAGIAWLSNTTFDIGGAAFIPIRHFNGVKSDSNMYVVPSAGFAVNPLGCNCDTPHFVYGVGMYGVSGMGVDWASETLAGGGMIQKAYSNMQMMEMTAGGAYRNGNLSIGFAPVFVYQALSLEYDWNIPDIGQTDSKSPYYQQLPPAGTYKDSLDTANSYGVGFDLGVVYKINDMLQIGLVYKSKRYMQKLEWNTTPGFMVAGNKVKMRLDMPRQIALGINFRPIKPLRLEADIRWINYHDVMNEVKAEGMMIPTWNFHWNNQWVFSLGAEYDVNKYLTLRTGFNYGQSPIDAKDLGNNIVAPAIVEKHATIGASYKFNKNVELSVAYAHAFKHEEKTTDPMFGPIKADMHQDTIAAQFTYNF